MSLPVGIVIADLVDLVDLVDYAAARVRTCGCTDEAATSVGIATVLH